MIFIKTKINSFQLLPENIPRITYSILRKDSQTKFEKDTFFNADLYILT